MSVESDADYFARRARDSRGAADGATGAGPAKIHTELATAYESLVHHASVVEKDAGQVRISADHGEVTVDGLDEAVRLLPEAAGLVADSLLRGARDAGRQGAASPRTGDKQPTEGPLATDRVER